MRKLVCFSLAILVLFCFTACNLNLNLEDLANESESAAITEEMLDILAEKRVDDAKALFHPQVDEEIDTAITQMCDFLDGRKAESVEIISININNSTGTGGRSRQEQVSYSVRLDDGQIIYASAVYLSDQDGDGFVSFQLILGII